MEYTDVQLLKELESLMTQLYSPNDDQKFRENLTRFLVNLTASKINIEDGGPGGSDDQDASEVPFAPTGGISSDNVQSALEELDGDKQASNSNLTAISGLTPAINDLLQFKGTAWINRTIAEVKSDLALDQVSNITPANLPISDAQAIVNASKLNAATASRTGTVIAFDVPATYGEATAETGNITIETTGAVNGIVQLVLHNSGSTPSFTAPGGATLLKSSGSGTYTTSVLNYIYIERISATKYIYSILQAS